MSDFDIENLFLLMREGVVTVTFRKKTDGSLRVMDCTLVDEYLPETTTVKKWPDLLIVVFDIENEVWRSFYRDTVVKLEDAEGNVIWEKTNG